MMTEIKPEAIAAVLLWQPKNAPGMHDQETHGSWAQGSSEEIAHAQGVLAARSLGGQVAQRDVNAARGTLEKAGLSPRTKKVKTLSKPDLIDFYTSNKPVTGDRWELPDGTHAEIGMIRPARINIPDKGWQQIEQTDIEVTYVGKRKGHSFDIRVPRNWGVTNL